MPRGWPENNIWKPSYAQHINRTWSISNLKKKKLLKNKNWRLVTFKQIFMALLKGPLLNNECKVFLHCWDIRPRMVQLCQSHPCPCTGLYHGRMVDSGTWSYAAHSHSQYKGQNKTNMHLCTNFMACYWNVIFIKFGTMFLAF